MKRTIHQIAGVLLALVLVTIPVLLVVAVWGGMRSATFAKLAVTGGVIALFSHIIQGQTED